MKIKILLGFILIILSAYLGYLFILPNMTNFEKYNPVIEKKMQEFTGIRANLDGIRLSTAWNLSTGLEINKADLKYPTGEKFAQINNLKIRLSLFNLLFKEIKIDNIEANKILFNVDIDKNNDFILAKYIKNTNKTGDFRFANTIHKINIPKYRISFVKGSENYTIKGRNLKISDFVPNKNIKISSVGNLFINNKNYINYDLSLISQYFPQINKKYNANDLIATFSDLQKYSIKSKIYSNVKIYSEKNEVYLDGNIHLNELSFLFANKRFPNSSIKLDFDKNNAKINASLHVSKNAHAQVTGFFKTGKNKYIDLHVLTDKINIEEILLIAKASSRSLGLKNISNINGSGILKANFDIKSNFKEVSSNGYLKIQDAKIFDKNYRATKINADVDFSKNSIHINNASANVNNQPIKISGQIDKNAFANILIAAQNLPLRGVIIAFGQQKLLLDNDIRSGIISVNSTIKGKLNKPSICINSSVRNILIKNKISLINIDNINIKANEKNGQAIISNTKVKSSSNIQIPKIKLMFDEKEVKIENSQVLIDNIKAQLSGKIVDIKTKPTLSKVMVVIPNNVSVPLQGYPRSNANLNGSILINGQIDNPKINGKFFINNISIPTLYTTIKNATVILDKDIKISAPYVKIANSQIKFLGIASSDFSKGFVFKDVNFIADTFDLNYITPLVNNLTSSISNTSITINNGSSIVKKFKVGNITAQNITANIYMKNNILTLKNMYSDAYLGKVAGTIHYYLERKRAYLKIQGRGLNAKLALISVTGIDDNLNGKLDFDGNLSFSGFSQNEIKRSLSGNTAFIITNGQMGILGKFEHLLYAQNIVANSIFKANLNITAKAVTARDTGVFKYMKGKIVLKNGWANIDFIKTAGPSMSTFMTGRCYIPENFASVVILGRISNDIVRILGPIGEFSMDKIVSYIPKLGEVTSYFANQFTTNPNYENISEIPPLIPKTEFKTKEFKVVIDGNVRKQSSVKSFKWLSHPQIIQAYSKPKPKQSQEEIPDFVKKLPDFKQ